MAKPKKQQTIIPEPGDPERVVAALGAGPSRLIAIEDCIPNTWNQNKMSQAIRTKVEASLKAVREATKTDDNPDGLPAKPITVRPHPEKLGKWQIIDGEHRWDIHRTNKWPRIWAWVVDVDEKTARLLTPILNYQHGEPDIERHANFFRELFELTDATPESVADLLPESAEEIREFLDNQDIHIERIEASDEANEREGRDPGTGDDVWVEFRVAVSKAQAQVVEAELARIGMLLGGGKNLRGRALEMMAVNSSQTPIEQFVDTGAPPVIEEPEDTTEVTTESIKGKLHGKAGRNERKRR